MTSRPAPRVSLLIVVRNGAAHIEAALRSARRQTIAELDILVVDDGSSDATCDIVRRHAAQDGRVRLEAGPQQGLAAVRNRSIELARAPWGAVLDSDDILHPRHVEWLLDLAGRSGAQLVAANMIAFSEEEAELFAAGADWAAERAIDLATFVAAGRIGGKQVSLGYLKPMFRLDALRIRGLAYDPRLRIGEDYDLVERALAAGLDYAFTPVPTYFYRRHPGSTSFRLTRADIKGLLAAEADVPPAPPGSALAAARAARRRSLRAALAHLGAVENLKARRVVPALAGLLGSPGAARLMVRSVREGMGRRFGGRSRGDAARGGAALLCGTPQPGSGMERAVHMLAAEGCELRRIADARSREPADIARAGRGAAMVLVTDEHQAEAAAFAICDGVPVIGDGSFAHPLIDRVLDGGEPEALLELARCGDPAPRLAA